LEVHQSHISPILNPECRLNLEQDRLGWNRFGDPTQDVNPTLFIELESDSRHWWKRVRFHQ
ncbi:MAG: hypothetical protein ACTS3R_02465, partial [Inquilinaceae bacterium]